MQKINLSEASKLTSPNPVSLVCTEKPDGSTNIATVSWWTYLSYNPNMISLAMAKTSFSGEMVRNNKKVILTIAALLVSASMVFAFAGCTNNETPNEDGSNPVVNSVEDNSNTPVADVTADVTAA